MQLRDDTIAAESTAQGRAAIAIVRLTGPAAHDVGARLAHPFPQRARHVALCELLDPASGTPLDRALVTRFDAPHSYTGEPMVEFACHGGRAVVASVLEACLTNGARLAEPGEFTQRAVLHGKLDLLQAEAVADLVDATTRAGRAVALQQLDGGLSRRVQHLRDQLVTIEALVAYDIDFPEEDDGPIAPARVLQEVGDCRAMLDALLRTAPLAEVAKEGAIVVIAGPPNAGKSSLFNALLGETRAIVTEVPGTTRDALEARVDHPRWPLRLYDTAGLRESGDVVERMGIEVSRAHVQRAHLVLACAPTPEAARNTAETLRALTAAPVILVRTKADLDRADAPHDMVSVSAILRTGLEHLLAAIHDALETAVGTVPADVPLVTRARQRVALEAARAELDAFVDAWTCEQLPATIAAVHVRAACGALDELIGSIDVDEVLARVFSTFCVGK